MTVSDGVSPSPKGGPEPARPPLNPPLPEVGSDFYISRGTVKIMAEQSTVQMAVGVVLYMFRLNSNLCRPLQADSEVQFAAIGLRVGDHLHGAGQHIHLSDPSELSRWLCHR